MFLENLWGLKGSTDFGSLSSQGCHGFYFCNFYKIHIEVNQVFFF